MKQETKTFETKYGVRVQVNINEIKKETKFRLSPCEKEVYKLTNTKNNIFEMVHGFSKGQKFQMEYGFVYISEYEARKNNIAYNPSRA